MIDSQLAKHSTTASTMLKAAAGDWHILLLADDAASRQVFRAALDGRELSAGRINLLLADSVTQLAELLRNTPDIALLILDTCTDADANTVLDLLRHELGNQETRVALLAGAMPARELRERCQQCVPRLQLDHDGLLDLAASALRDYQEITGLRQEQRTLEKLLSWTRQLFGIRDRTLLAERVLRELQRLLGLRLHGLFCATAPQLSKDSHESLRVLACNGRFAGDGLLRKWLYQLPDDSLQSAIESCFVSHADRLSNTQVMLFLDAREAGSAVVFLRSDTGFDEHAQLLLRRVSVILSQAFDNAARFESMRRAAFYDELTGLANRHQFLASTNALIERYPNERLRLLLVDIDHFQEVNDGLGNEAGDHVLKQVAERLRAVHPEPNVVARVSGDTFGILMPETSLALWRPSLLAGVFDQTVAVMGSTLPISATAAAADYPQAAATAEQLFTAAGIALKEAKRTQRGVFLQHQNDMDVALRERLKTIARLRVALDREALQVYYQPFIQLKTGRVVGFEALCRWPRRNGEFTPPAHFIPAAEKSGLIAELGRMVLHTACQDACEWTDQDGRGIRVSVNISMHQLQHPNIQTTVADILAETGLRPGLLELEVTESMIMNDEQPLIQTLKQFSDLGATIAVDDFGTGYSSLAYLQQLPVQRLKIDRRFIQQIDTSQADADIAYMIIKLGQRLGLRVVAEGVETEGQYRKLCELGCDEAQGYLFAPPRPLDELSFGSDWSFV